jgi:glycosyltransferase involved in cell wall biosynthesis
VLRDMCAQATGFMIPAYTALIPVFNGERYVRRAIESALAQDVTGEIVVVNDGSTDRSSDIARSYGRQVRVIEHPRNLGISAARNTGISSTTAPIIAFLDADDRWQPGKLRAQLQFLNSEPGVAAVFSDFRTVAPDGGSLGWQGGLKAQLSERGLSLHPVNSKCSVLGGDVHFALMRYTSFMHPSTVVARRAALTSAGLFNPTLRCAEDLDIWIRLAESGTIGYVDDVLTIVEARPDSLGHQSETMSSDLARLYEALLTRGTRLPKEVHVSIVNRLAELYATLGWIYAERKDYRAAATYFGRSLKHRSNPRVHIARAMAATRSVVYPKT